MEELKNASIQGCTGANALWLHAEQQSRLSQFGREERLSWVIRKIRMPMDGVGFGFFRSPSSGAGFSLRGLVLAKTKNHRLKPAPLNPLHDMGGRLRD
jgi:hypothetical protein